MVKQLQTLISHITYHILHITKTRLTNARFVVYSAKKRFPMDQSMNVPPTKKCCGTCIHMRSYNLAYRQGTKCFSDDVRGKEKDPDDLCDNHKWTNESLEAEYLDGILKLAEQELNPLVSTGCDGCIFDSDRLKRTCAAIPCIEKDLIWKTADDDPSVKDRILEAFEAMPDKIAEICKDKLARYSYSD